MDDGEGNFVPDAVFADGSDARRMKDRYSILYDSVMQAYVRLPGLRVRGADVRVDDALHAVQESLYFGDRSPGDGA